MSDSSDGELSSSSSGSGEEDDFMIGKKTKRGKRESIYGAFAESEEEDDERDGKRRRSRGGRRNDFSKPVGFTRAGAFHGKKGEEEEYEEEDDDDDVAEERRQSGSGASGLGGVRVGGGGGGLGFTSNTENYDDDEDARTGIGGGGLGLGFAPAGATNHEEEEEEEEEDFDLLPSSFGQRVVANARQRMRDAEEARNAAKRKREEAKAKESFAAGLGNEDDDDTDDMSNNNRKRRNSNKDVGHEKIVKPDFEKHTKGIGAKLLAKMGYKPGQGLGADGKGISRAIETKLRPKNMGMGYGDFEENVENEKKTQQKKKNGGRRGGADYESEKLASEKRIEEKRNNVETIEKKLWKRSAKEDVKRKAVRYETPEELIARRERERQELDDNIENNNANEGSFVEALHQPKMKIIDMSKRGGARELEIDGTSFKSTTGQYLQGDSDDDEQRIDDQHLPGRELLRNLNAMGKLAASNISLYDAKVRTEMDTSAALMREQERLSQIEKDVKKAEEDIRTLNEKVKLLVENEKDENDEKILEQWLELKRDHKEAFAELDIAAVAAQKHAKKYFEKAFRAWDPKNQNEEASGDDDKKSSYKLAYENCGKWRDVLVSTTEIVKKQESFLNYTDDPVIETVEDETLLEEVIETPVTMKIIRTLIQGWDPRDVKSNLAMDLFYEWQSVLPRRSLDKIVENAIIPKLTREIEKWTFVEDAGDEGKVTSSSSSSVPSKWIFPWLEMLLEPIKALSSTIKQKFANVIDASIGGKAVAVVEPWVEVKTIVFGRTWWSQFVEKTVVPKLVAKASLIEIDPADQNLEIFNNILLWKAVLASSEETDGGGGVAKVLERSHFWKKWSSTLKSWLKDEKNCDLIEVAEWYESWKTLLGEDVCNHERPRTHLRRALEAMNAAATGEPIALSDGEDDEDARQTLAGRDKSPGKTRKIKSSSTAKKTLKDILESVASENDFAFLPKNNRRTRLENLPVFAFGGVTVAVDANKDVVSVLATGAGEESWHVVGIEELVELARMKASMMSDD
jgi:hypothetical protein